MTTTFKTIFEAADQAQQDVAAWAKSVGIDVKLKNGQLVSGKNINLANQNIDVIPMKFAPMPTKNFNINSNQLTSLVNSPDECKEFDAGWNNITSLEGGPRIVHGDYVVSSNENLSSLKGAPELVEGDFFAIHCGITHLGDLPDVINGNIRLQHNKLESLKDIHKFIKKMNNGTIYIGGNPIKGHVMGLLMIPGLKAISAKARTGPDDENLMKVMAILNKYVGKGRAGILSATDELVDNDLDDYAEI